MSRMGFSERVRIAAVRAQGLQRQAATNVLNSGLLRWRQGSAALRELVIVPGDLRSRDPSFWPEVESGLMGLSGGTVDLNGRSPFDIAPPSEAWQRNLHGFSWLRHLEAADDANAQKVAQRYLLDWLANPGLQDGNKSDPSVRARRVISWISYAPFLLEGASLRSFDSFANGLAREVMVLSGTWRNAKAGYPRLLALTALVVAHLAVKGSEKQLTSTLRLLVSELERQILSDGGHASRDPSVLVDLLLDWLPLKSCFDAREVLLPDAFTIAITRMLAMLRYMKLGDGAVARFNGAGVGDPAALATLGAYDERPLPDWRIAPESRYARLECGPSILIADVGAAPALLMSSEAHAGCLSFEMSVGHSILFVNCGAPSEADVGWRAVSRATASHSTVCLGEISSARLVRHSGLEAQLGGVPLQLPSIVKSRLEKMVTGQTLDASHDGYLARLGLMHRRELQLSADGRTLVGLDWLETKGQDRLRRDVPFAVHFHLHPDSHCERMRDDAGDEAAMIYLQNGQRWRFHATGAAMTIEESTFFAGNSGPRAALQIVLRGACAGVSEVRWQAVFDKPVAASVEITGNVP